MNINNLIKIINKEKDINKRVELFRSANEKYPDHIKLQYNYLNSLIKQNSTQNIEELNYLFDLLTKQKTHSVIKITTLIKKAEFLSNIGKNSDGQAILLYIIFSEEGFLHDWALYKLGVLKLKNHDIEMAKEIFEQCILSEDKITMEQSYLDLINIEIENKNYNKALAYIDDVLNIPNLTINLNDVLIKKAKIYRLQTKFKEAHQCLNTINENTKSYIYSMSQFEQARLAIDEENYDQARTIYNNLIENGYLLDKLDSYYELGLLEEKLHNPNKAKENFSNMLKIKEKVKKNYIEY